MAAIRLPSVLDISAEEFIPELRAAVTGEDLVIDAGGVTRIDAAGLQLLCAAAVTVRGQGHAVTWQAPTSVLIDGARVLGLLAVLGLPLAAE